MKDWYLRFILTVIAACLVFQVVESCSPTPVVAASSDVIEVRIVEIDQPYSGSSLDWDPLPVTIVD